MTQLTRLRFNLELFQALNEEYRDRRIVPRPRSHEPKEQVRRGSKLATKLVKTHGIAGKRVLEIGCGRGEVLGALAAEHACRPVGVDIKRYPQWAGEPGCTFITGDLADPAVAADLEPFDFIYSLAVWEHIRHPFAMLKRAHALLVPGGVLQISANLYRGPKASHRYREVFFPWSHILFTDEVFEAFYVSIGQKPQRPAWINQLTIADYLRYFDLAGFRTEAVSFNVTPIDEPFYWRFADILERIPRYDLERDFIHATLVKPETLRGRMGRVLERQRTRRQ